MGKNSARGLNFDITASTAKFQRDMNKAKDIARNSGVGIGKSLSPIQNISKGVTKSITAMSKSVVGLGAAYLTLNTVKDAVKTFAEFESAMTAVNTILNLDREDLESLSAEARKAAVAVGDTPKGFADAMYQAVSAGVEYDKVIAVTTRATKLAKAGFTDTATAIDLVTTVMNSYGDAAGDINNITDILLNTQNRGKTTIAELGQSFGMAIPQAAVLGVKFEVLAGAVQTMTARGIDTATTMTSIRALMTALSAPTDLQKKKYQELGIAWSEARLSGDGMVSLLKEIIDRSGGSIEALTQLGINQRALNAALSLGGQGFDHFTESIQSNTEAAGTLNTSFAQVSENLEEKVKKLAAAWDNFAIVLVNSVSPALGFVVDQTEDLLEAITLLMDNSELKLDLKEAEKQLNHFWGRYESLSEIVVKDKEKLENINKKLAELESLSAKNTSQRLQESIKYYTEEKKAAEENVAEMERRALAAQDQARVWNVAVNDIKKALRGEKDAIEETGDAAIDASNKIGDAADSQINDSNQTTEETLSGLEERIAGYSRYSSEIDTVLNSMLATEEDINRKRVESYLESINRMKEIDAERSASRQADNEEWLKTDYELAAERIANYQQYTNAAANLADNLLAAQNANVDNQLNKEITAAQRSYNVQKALIEKRYTENGELSEAGIQKMNELEEGHAALVENLETKALQQKQQNARRLKTIRIAQAIANTAAAVVEALPNLILAGIVAASGAAQIATIRAQPYAKGGIVDEPTFFKSNNQLSVMGEAGKEAIMPVTRTSKGDLGVRVVLPEGAGGTNVLNMNLSFNGNVMEREYVERTVVPILQEGARKGFNKLMVKK